MAKRRLSKQQQRRIATSQKQRIQDQRLLKNRGDEQDLELDESSSQTAIVVSHHGRELVAETEDRDRLKCRIRQNLGDIACGDRVLIQSIIQRDDTPPANMIGESSHVVIAIQERDNLLTKTGFGGSIKAVAANIGQLVIVAAVQPKPNPYLIDRYLAAAENLPAKSVIVINKADQIGDDADEFHALADSYTDIGYPVIFTSVKLDKGIAELSKQLQHTTSILVGLSGVGKSSIVKKILPDETIRIGDTSTATGEGKHTTTVSALYHLDGTEENDGIIIDSPGVRDFTPTFENIDQVTLGFRDIREFAGHCRFSNCSHHHEPGCALIDAVRDGSISKRRLDNYLRLLDEVTRM
jgi:ribosome biogenesis GTPase